MPRHSILGRAELVLSVTEVDVRLKKKTETVEVTAQDMNSSYLDGIIPENIRQIDLPNLSTSQKQSAFGLLSEESESVSKNYADIGSVPELKLRINLADKTPLQKLCCSS